MLSAILWDSALEDSSRQSPLFLSSEVSVAAHHGTEPTFAASPPQEQDLFSSCLPDINEALFDISEIPELEDAEFLPSTIDHLMLDVPPLEDEWFSEELLATFVPTAPPDIPEEGILEQSPTEVSEPEVSLPEITSSFEFVVSKLPPSPVTSYGSLGSESPMSCYSNTSEDSLNGKRRRISRNSVSSYCSSPSGESSWSPATSDSEIDSKRPRRKSKFTPEDRKERKKAQNRSAAERYRQKRKQQEETITEEEQGLIDGNNDLKLEMTKLQAEVSCLKHLLRDMLQAKGVPIPPPKKKKNSV